MKITDIRLKLTNATETKLKAIASITLDECFVIHDIKIIEGQEGLFIAMPSKKSNSGEFKDIAHPINIETRKSFCEAILTEYKTVISNAQI